MDLRLDDEVPRGRLGLLLEEFSHLDDDREPWRVVYPLAEVLFLMTCTTIADCDDFDDIVAWGEHHLDFLRRLAPYHNGLPCARWLRALMDRIDPAMFAACFEGWVRALWPGRHDIIAIDGKTSRRSHDKRKGLKALHTLSAYASNARLVLTQLSVPEKANEITAIPDVLDHLAQTGQLKGALVTIDAMGTQFEIANKILAYGADYLLPLKGNQPTLEADVIDYFRTAPASELTIKSTVEKGHGRIETRVFTASSTVDFLTSERSYPGQHRFKGIRTILKVLNRSEYADKCTFDTRYYICSAPLDIERIAAACRGHWGVESMHWILDVEFNDDLSRYRAEHGVKNIAALRRFALNLVRANKRKGSVKTRRKSAGWDPKYLLEILSLP